MAAAGRAGKVSPSTDGEPSLHDGGVLPYEWGGTLMYFRQFVHEGKSCLSYLIGCQSHRAAIVIDPQENVEPYVAAAKREGMRIQQVLDTHTHADHVSGALALAEAVGASLMLPQGGEVFRVGNRVVNILATPGHTEDSVSLFIDDWYVLTGDTLFVSDVGRVDLTLGGMSESVLQQSAEQLYVSLQRLLTLPEWTEVYPGHFGGSACGKGLSGKMISTIGRERRKNRALRLSHEEFVRYVLTDVPPPPRDFREIKHRNIADRERVHSTAALT